MRFVGVIFRIVNPIRNIRSDHGDHKVFIRSVSYGLIVKEWFEEQGTRRIYWWSGESWWMELIQVVWSGFFKRAGRFLVVKQV